MRNSNRGSSFESVQLTGNLLGEIVCRIGPDLGECRVVMRHDSQLADGHAETLDEEQDVLVHLRVAVWGRMGWRASCRLGGQCVPARMRRAASGVERTTPKGTAPWSSVKKNEGVGGISLESGT